MSVPHRNAANLVSIPSLFSPRALPLAADVAVAVLLLPAPVAAHADGQRLRVLGDAALHVPRVARLGGEGVRGGHGQQQSERQAWQGEVGRWHSDSENSTQVGLSPALRWKPNGWSYGWFVEGGIGVNVIFPKYNTHSKEFSTTFNFGDHIAVGKRFGSDDQHEWSLRFQHFSNARIKRPNPGENFLQFRYTHRL